MARNKKRIPGPRLHRLKRSARLDSARAWLPKYEGKKIVHSYRRRYGVDLRCAIAELQMLDVPLDPTYVDRVRTTVENEIKRRAARKKAPSTDHFVEVDSAFAHIVGHTEGGAASEMNGNGRLDPVLVASPAVVQPRTSLLLKACASARRVTAAYT
jgi:hypothetical protein